MRLEHEIRGHDVILVKRRAALGRPDAQFGRQRMVRPLAPLRHSAVGWRLYWPDSDNRWYLQSELQFGAQQLRTLGQA